MTTNEESEEYRRLTVLMFADIKGYTALMGRDERNALDHVARFEQDVQKHVGDHNGRVIQFYGDGCLLQFNSAKDAVTCAWRLQIGLLQEPQVPARIGIHLGDTVHRDGNVYGDSVNITSRIESMGVPGAVLFSGAIHQQIRNDPALESSTLGKFRFKNVDKEMEVFALKAEGLVIPKRSDLKGKFAERNGQRPFLLVILALVLFGIGYVFVKPFLQEEHSGVRTLAILPFELPEGNDAMTYLADGIPENLINRMSNAQSVNVLSRNSTFAMREYGDDIGSLRKKLPADMILTGSISQIQNTLVVNCRLIDLETGNQVWGRTMRNSVGDVFALEDSIVNALEAPLRISLGGQGIKHVPDPEAYTHYLKGRMLFYGSTAEESDKALVHFKEAIRIDPEFALAYAGLAKVKYVATMFGNATTGELVRDARQATQMALKLDPDLVEAHLAEANIKFYLDHDWEGAEEAFLTAAAIDPRNVDLNIEYAYFENMMGRFEKAVDLADRALALDPISTASLHMAAWTRLFTEEYAEAAELLSKALELHPSWAWGWLKYGTAMALDGDCAAAIEATDKASQLVDNWGAELLQSYAAVNYAFCNDSVRLQSVVDRMLTFADTSEHTQPISYMLLAAAMHDEDMVISFADRGIRERVVNNYALHTIPLLKCLDPDMFDSPEFKALVHGMAFPVSEDD